jgi:hypothetical protein
MFSTSQNKNPLTDESKHLNNSLCRRHHQVGQSSWWSAGGLGSPYRWNIRFGKLFFFPVTSRASPQPAPRARAPNIIHQSTWFRPRRSLLGVSSIRLIPRGSNPQKTLILGTSMGIPSLNVYGRISAQDKHITTLDSSKCASRQDTQCLIVKTKRWGHCRGQTYKSLFQRQIYSQIPKHSRKCRITF